MGLLSCSHALLAQWNCKRDTRQRTDLAVHFAHAAGCLFFARELNKADLLALAGVVAKNRAGLDLPKFLHTNVA